VNIELDTVVDLVVAVLALVALRAVAAIALGAGVPAAQRHVDARALIEAGPLPARLHLHLLAVLALVLLHTDQRIKWLAKSFIGEKGGKRWF
jgi:hypothetical protein